MPNLLRNQKLPILLAGLLLALSSACQALQEEAKIRLQTESRACETSAMLAADCGSGTTKCLWLADNEVTTQIYRLAPTDAAVQAPADASLSGAIIDDIEALASLSSQRILIVGSSSHNSKCEPLPERARLGVYDINRGSTQIVNWRDAAFTCKGARLNSASPSTGAFCAALEQGRKLAAQAYAAPTSERETLCDKVEALNIEGAATAASGRTWLGLRAPLLSRPGDATMRDAVLLRMAPIRSVGAPQVDSLRKLDLGGRGIRELSASRDWLWIVAGPPLDASDPFQLYRLAWPALESGTELLKPEHVAELETSTEGFALLGDAAYTAVDGDKKSDACKSGTHQHLRRLAWPGVGTKDR